MASPKNDVSKTAKVAESAKKKCCKKKTASSAADVVESPKKKCCRKKTDASQQVAVETSVVVEKKSSRKKCCKSKNATENVTKKSKQDSSASSKASVAKEAAVKPAPQKVVAKKEPVKQPVPVVDEKEDVAMVAQLKAIEAAKAQLAAIPEWPQFVEQQKQNLLDLRDKTLDSMQGVTRDTLRKHPEGSEASGSGEHQADAGSDAYDREFALSMLSKEKDGLYEIEQALERIKNGTYGICEMSFQIIPIPRLEAIPFARLTVQCQAQVEKEKGMHGNYRSRTNLGFAGVQNETDLTVSLDEDEE